MNGYLAHHGILGQKWGVRRYQNKDGSLTPEGYKRYGSIENAHKKKQISNRLRALTSSVAVIPMLALRDASRYGPSYRDFVAIGAAALAGIISSHYDEEYRRFLNNYHEDLNIDPKKIRIASRFL